MGEPVAQMVDSESADDQLIWVREAVGVDRLGPDSLQLKPDSHLAELPRRSRPRGLEQMEAEVDRCAVGLVADQQAVLGEQGLQSVGVALLECVLQTNLRHDLRIAEPGTPSGG